MGVSRQHLALFLLFCILGWGTAGHFSSLVPLLLLKVLFLLEKNNTGSPACQDQPPFYVTIDYFPWS